MALLKSSGANGPKIERDAKRARCWAEINFKCIPLQEGEDDESAEIDNEPDELPPIPDPLGITGSDLRNIQDLYASGMATECPRTKLLSNSSQANFIGAL